VVDEEVTQVIVTVMVWLAVLSPLIALFIPQCAVRPVLFVSSCAVAMIALYAWDWANKLFR
jgi:hypothetical protein